jgi:hypothetical protein
MRGSPAVGPTEEAIALEAPNVAADGHLGHAELSRQRADADRLVLGDLLEDPVAAIYGLHELIFSGAVFQERTSLAA